VSAAARESGSVAARDRRTTDLKICVITQPMLGSIQARLSLVTHAYFDQGNFEDTEVLAHVRQAPLLFFCVDSLHILICHLFVLSPQVHKQLNAHLSKPIEEPSFYVGTIEPPPSSLRSRSTSASTSAPSGFWA
jgi:hypothetical protein